MSLTSWRKLDTFATLAGQLCSGSPGSQKAQVQQNRQTVEVVVTCFPNRKTQKFLEYCSQGPLDSVGTEDRQNVSPDRMLYIILSLSLSSRALFHLPHLRIGCGVATGDKTARGQPQPMEVGGLCQEGQWKGVPKPDNADRG